MFQWFYELGKCRKGLAYGVDQVENQFARALIYGTLIGVHLPTLYQPMRVMVEQGYHMAIPCVLRQFKLHLRTRDELVGQGSRVGRKGPSHREARGNTGTNQAEHKDESSITGQGVANGAWKDCSRTQAHDGNRNSHRS